VKPFREWPIISDLRRRGLLFPVALGTAAAALLVQGAWSRRSPPPSPAPSPLASPAGTDFLPQLRPGLEKAPLEYLSDYWYQLAQRARVGVVTLGRSSTPVVVLAPGTGVTSLAAADMLAPSGESRGSRFAVVGRDTDASLAVVNLDASLAGAPLPLSTLEGLHPGALVATISVGPDAGLEVTPAHLVAISVSDPTSALASGPPSPESSTLELSVVPRSVVAGAVVDLDGRLIGVAVEDGRGDVRVLSATAAMSVVEHVRRGTACRPIEVGSLAPAVATLLGAEGALVERVHAESFAGPPPVRAGDVIVAWADEPVRTAEEFEIHFAAQSPGSTSTLTVLRGRQRVRVSLGLPASDCRSPAREPVRLDRLGLTLVYERPQGGPGDGWRASSVAPGGEAARSGLASGDWLLQLDRAPLGGLEGRSRLEALARRTQPVLLTVRRGERTLLVALSFRAGDRREGEGTAPR
jgi:S1-C subfamily serine protease